MDLRAIPGKQFTTQRSVNTTALVRLRRLTLRSFFPFPNLYAPDHQPQHERHLSEEAGERDVRELIPVLR